MTMTEEGQGITSVQINALVVFQIIQNCQNFYPDSVAGQLLGLDEDDTGVLHISYSFPFPSDMSNDGEGYQMEMMRCLREVNVDHNAVGWYASQPGLAMSKKLLNTQYNYQQAIPSSILVLFDYQASMLGLKAFKAYRLSPTFMNIYRDQKFSLDNLIREHLSFASMVEELPVIMSASTLSTHSLVNSNTLLHLLPTPLQKNTVEQLLENSLDRLQDAVEDHSAEMNRFQHFSKSFQRYQQLVNNALVSRRTENEARKRRGEDPIPEMEATAHLKAPYEPSRLESLILQHEMSSICEQIDQLTLLALTYYNAPTSK